MIVRIVNVTRHNGGMKIPTGNGIKLLELVYLVDLLQN